MKPDVSFLIPGTGAPGRSGAAQHSYICTVHAGGGTSGMKAEGNRGRMTGTGFAGGAIVENSGACAILTRCNAFIAVLIQSCGSLFERGETP